MILASLGRWCGKGRNGSAYDVHDTSSPVAALSPLRDIAARGGEVALVLAAHDLTEKTCMDISTLARELHPIARRGRHERGERP